jgi:uroporphyrinogen decarboxylase
METPRERVLKAIDHVQPETTPVHIMGFENMGRWLDRFDVHEDYELRDRLGLDVRFASAVYHGPNAELGLTIWGTKPIAAGYAGYGYSNSRGDFPLAGASISDIERFDWPDPEDFDYAVTAEALESVTDHARFVRSVYAVQHEGLSRVEAARGGGHQLPMRVGGWLPLICTLFDLFGLEETLINFRAEPKIIEAAVSRLEEFVLGFTRRQLEATKGATDVYWYGDDFATQRGIMISPDLWRKYLLPTYGKIFELAKGYGLKMWFHSCGTFRPVLPDLIDAGMDVWETVPGNEPEVLKREYGQDIAFYGAINSQQTMPLGTPEDVRAEVRERVRVLGKGGGYICGSDHTILPDVPIENVMAMVDEARNCSP